jgi:hypothetical protein
MSDKFKELSTLSRHARSSPRMRAWGGLVATALVLICAGGADGAVVQRYVSVAGSGTACTPSEPCSLRNAAASSATGDEVISSPPEPTPKLHRSPCQTARKTCTSTDISPARCRASTPPWEKPPPSTFRDTGGRPPYFEVVNVADSGYGASCLLEGTLERVKLVVQGQDAIGLFQGPGCTLRDSLVRAEGPGGGRALRHRQGDLRSRSHGRPQRDGCRPGAEFDRSVAQLPGRRPDLHAVADAPQLDRQGGAIRPLWDRLRVARLQEPDFSFQCGLR